MEWSVQEEARRPLTLHCSAHSERVTVTKEDTFTMRVSTWLAAATMVFAVAGIASAQGVTPTLDKGTTEYALRGNIHFNSPSSQDITVRWAPFIDRNWQWGVDLSASHIKSEHDESGHKIAGTGTTGFVGAIGNYHFRSATEGPLVPYVGAALGTTFGSGSNSTVWGFQGGVKYFLTTNVALIGELDWRHADKDSFAGRKSTTDLNFGLAFFR